MFGQGNTGAILGTITDTSGAVVPSAKVTVTNVQTNVASDTQSDSVGNYAVRYLSAGQYRVEAEFSGFKKLVRENIQLDLFRELRVDLTLEAGANVESVTITGTAALLETETGSLSSTMESRQVTSLPLSTRDPTQLENFIPGVVQGPEGTVSNGGQVRRDTYLVDGANNTTHVWGNPTIAPNPDMLEEFKILTNSFSAEYGQTSGSVMVTSMKSGTNQVHGSLFEFFQNTDLNAGNFFTHQVPALHYNQFGGTVGGPIRKNKTFAFFAYQNTRQTGMTAYTNASVPQPAFIQGNFSQILGGQVGTDALGRPVYGDEVFDPLSSRNTVNSAGQTVVVRDPFPGNIIPTSRLSPAALKAAALYPAPQSSALAGNWNSTGLNLNYTKTYDLRLDHNFSESNKLMARYGKNFNRNDTGSEFPDPRSGGVYNNTPNHFVTVNFVHVFSPKATNDLHVNWWQNYAHRTVGGTGTVSENDMGIYGLPNGADRDLATPLYNFTNFTSVGPGYSSLMYQLEASRSIVDTASIALARHTIKFGGEVRQLRTDNLQPNNNNGDFTFNNSFTNQVGLAQSGYDFASFMLGLPVSTTYTIFPDMFRTRTTIFALFVQDDFRVNKKLTLNIGLRFDAPLWWHEAQNRSGVFNLQQNQWVQFGTSGLRTTPWDNDLRNLGPRLGFAYSPFGSDKTVIRGAYGMFTVGTGQSFRESYMQLTPFFALGDGGTLTSTDNIHWTNTLDNIPFSAQSRTGAGYTEVEVYPDHNPMAYMQQWNFNVGHQFKDVLVQVGYAGSKGTHLNMGGYEGDYNMNAIPGNMLSQAQGRFIAPYVPYPQFPTGVLMEQWIGSSSYNSLQVKVERRFAGGFGVMGAYTFQKTIDVGDTGYRDPVDNRNLDRGLSENSIPQRLTAAWNYALPWGRGRQWLTSGPLIYPLGGWELNGTLTLQSGMPLNPTENYNSEVAGAEVFNAPNVSSDPVIPSSQRTLQRWFNTSVFSLPALYTMGDAGKGLIFGPGMSILNIDLSKRFYGFGNETRNLEFRAEAYNLFNTPTFGNPNVTADSAQFGHITSASNSRTMQLALKFYF